MPWWPSTTSVKEQKEKATDWTEPLNKPDWSHYTDPRNLIPVVLLTTTCIGSYAFYRSYLRRIPQASFIQANFWRRRSLLGKVTRVGDGDNFHLFHTPGGRLAGWGWLPWRRVPIKAPELKGKTVQIRLAGIDAPEMAHFGRPEQPGGKEALDWLTKYLLGKRVRAYVYRKDQYDRAVASVYVWKWLIRRDVGLQMLRKGLATVYEAKSGAEFGAVEKKYRSVEEWAKRKRKGIWAGKRENFESPRDYKTRHGEK
ncbi:MAG: putative endonuclease lcl3 [Ramalina farinacea]|uniref:Probable endonuclease LCL3 n=1 Tax=Ramalina farinacea TaxID=258253 RepID=A0AA43TVM9_9LECA|nr:putative endonuclease lcl3 [Ramalina farinacea]